MKSIFQLWKDSCMSGSKMSSKRLIMYTFTFTAVFMILIEAFFNLLLMYRWYKNGCPDDVEFLMVFDAIIYGYIFALIGALAGVNGWEGKGKKVEVKTQVTTTTQKKPTITIPEDPEDEELG